MGIHLNHPKNVPLPDITWNSGSTKILGVYFTPSLFRSVKLNLDAILSSTESRTTHLSSRNLSLKGRAVVVNSLLLSKAWFVSRVFLPPPSHAKKIERTIFNYLLHFKHEKNNLFLFAYY